MMCIIILFSKYYWDDGIKNLGVDGRIRLKCIFGKYVWRI
jgi:hypothetical protein